jgi:pimeloyl-ACP methyl ester carboxylesterase
VAQPGRGDLQPDLPGTGLGRRDLDDLGTAANRPVLHSTHRDRPLGPTLIRDARLAFVETITAPDGTTLVARRTGDGTPVVLVHGSAGGLDSWDPVLPFLADVEAWVYARRGYPPSDGAAAGKTFADDVADLGAVLAAVGEPAHLVGGSYGGTVALHAVRGGERVRSLTVWEAPLYAAGPSLVPVLDRYRALLAAGQLPAADRLFAEEVARVPREILDALGELPGDPGELESCLHDLEAMAADDPDLGRWAGIDVPTLLMQGSDTWSPMPETMDALAAVLSDATRVTLDGQNHFATHTAPELWAGTLRRILQDH